MTGLNWTAPKISPRANEVANYWPEMGEDKPATVGEIRGYGKWMTVKSPVKLKTSRSVVYISTYKSSDLANYPKAQAKVGWHEYRVTDKGEKEVLNQITLSREVLLD